MTTYNLRHFLPNIQEVYLAIKVKSLSLINIQNSIGLLKVVRNHTLGAIQEADQKTNLNYLSSKKSLKSLIWLHKLMKPQ